MPHNWIGEGGQVHDEECGLVQDLPNPTLDQWYDEAIVSDESIDDMSEDLIGTLQEYDFDSMALYINDLDKQGASVTGRLSELVETMVEYTKPAQKSGASAKRDKCKSARGTRSTPPASTSDRGTKAMPGPHEAGPPPSELPRPPEGQGPAAGAQGAQSKAKSKSKINNTANNIKVSSHIECHSASSTDVAGPSTLCAALELLATDPRCASVRAAIAAAQGGHQGVAGAAPFREDICWSAFLCAEDQARQGQGSEAG